MFVVKQSQWMHESLFLTTELGSGLTDISISSDIKEAELSSYPALALAGCLCVDSVSTYR